MENKEFSWKKIKKTGVIEIYRTDEEGKKRKVFDLTMDNMPSFAAVFNEIKADIQKSVENQIGKYQKIMADIFEVEPAGLKSATILKGTEPIDRTKPVHENQKVPPSKQVESNGDVDCNACGKVIAEKVMFTLCTVCQRPAHNNHTDEGVCTKCIEGA